ncbi:unnamed protein product [Prunus armeniaca]|uniref:Uncharacterized protein n=1 Tax=Prunus armeniaca TaxID=36596 RepID=A0A6J5W829_PRUAR|nr:unnamed protein product [Prunus armeniaca]
MIHLAFFAGTGVKVANELGAGNGQEAKFAAKVSAAESVWSQFYSMVFNPSYQEWLWAQDGKHG